jgi:serine protease
MNRPSAIAAIVLRGAGRVLCAAAGLCVLPAAAEPVDTVRLMLHPSVAARGDLPAERQARLEAIAGTALSIAGTTRTGALELKLAQPMERADANALLKRLRQQRAVLWAEPARAYGAGPSVRGRTAPSERGYKMLVRLADGVSADWDSLAARFTSSLGVAVAPQRRIGDVWVVALAQPQSASQLAELADALQQDPLVRYADPVLRKHALAAALPNDPRFGEQWGLSDPLSGIGFATAFALGAGLPRVTVAVVDTGVLPHPDLTGRVLPGFDFVSSPENARDGDARDADPRDEGDWRADGECGGFPGQDSFWHGTFIAGQIAANTNNGVGIAGVASNADILPVRVLGKCGGTDEDVFEGMLWAAGVPIDGVPANPNPAKVINLSLGGFGSCTQAIQEAIDDAMAHGAIVVAAAGNDAEDASVFNPANCSGVITVGAHNRAGDRSFYSNFGTRVDVSAPSGDGGLDDSTLSTANDGTTVPGEPNYVSGIGTSFAAPYVSAVAAMIVAKNGLLTPGRVLSLMQGSARDFPFGSTCSVGNVCGTGLLDAGVAFASAPPSSADAPPGTVAVIEYYDATRDHYFQTADPLEAALIDANGWLARTGNVFFAWNDPALAPPGAVSVCRFSSPDPLIASWYFTPSAGECNYVLANGAGTWIFESGAAFWVVFPDANGSCPAGMVPVYRFSNNRRDFNQRFTTDLSARRAMINRSWAVDGYWANGVAFCSPVLS